MIMAFFNFYIITKHSAYNNFVLKYAELILANLRRQIIY